jgi:hypothetical protein
VGWASSSASHIPATCVVYVEVVLSFFPSLCLFLPIQVFLSIGREGIVLCTCRPSGILRLFSMAKSRRGLSKFRFF